MKKKGLLKVIIGVVLVATLAVGLPLMGGCRPAPPEVAPIIVGQPLPLTGAPAADAEEMYRGTTLALEDWNARGGLLGRQIEWYTADVVDWGAEDQVAARDYLMAKNVDVFLPGYGLDPCIYDIFSSWETGGIPYLHCGVTELFAEIAASDTERYWNMIQTDDSSKNMYGQDAYLCLTKNIAEVYEYPKKTVAILTAELTYNIDISNAFRDLIEADPEWEVVVDEIHTLGALDFGVQLAKVRAANPGIVYMNDVVVPAEVAFVRQFLENPTDSVVFCQYAPSVPEFREMLGEQSIGVMWQTIVAPNPTPEFEEFKKRYIERWGEPPGACLAPNAYDMADFWARAVEAVGDVKAYREISDYLVATPMKGFTYGPGGWNVCPICRSDRGPASPYIEECHPGARKGEDRGASMHFFQIQMTSEGPQHIILYMFGKPTEEYMLKHYGYPPVNPYIDEVGATFKLPPWLK